MEEDEHAARVSRTRTSWMSRTRPCAAAAAASEASMRWARSRLGQLPACLRLGWLDVGLDLDVVADLRGDRVFELRGEPMSVAERHRAVDFEIEGDGLARFDILDGDMVHRQASARRDHQHPLEDRLVVERERIGGDGQFGLGPAPDDSAIEARP